MKIDAGVVEDCLECSRGPYASWIMIWMRMKNKSVEHML